MKTDLFQAWGHDWVFQIFWHIESSTFTASSFRIWNSSTGISTSFVHSDASQGLLDFILRLSGSRWVITPSWLSGSLRLFFPSSHVLIWKLDHREGWALKNGCFWIVLLEKTLKSPVPSKEIKSINPKGNKSTLNTHWKDWCWSWNSSTLATWGEELTHWKRPWC